MSRPRARLPRRERTGGLSSDLVRLGDGLAQAFQLDHEVVDVVFVRRRVRSADADLGGPGDELVEAHLGEP